MALGHIISTISVKGGVGKTTTCFLLAQELVHRGLSVAVIDLDPNSPFLNLRRFREASGREPLCSIYGLKEMTDENFFRTIDKISAENDFTLIDCEGSQNFLLTKAASVSTLTILPLKHSPLDAWSLPTVTQFVEEQSRVMRRPLPYRALLNFTAGGAVVTNWEKDIISDLDAASIPRFQTLLYEGTLFKDMWGEASTLYEMQHDAQESSTKADTANRHVKAIGRMRELCDEVFAVMREGEQ